MDTISCKRFRRFENLEPITLKDVNFFVGPNNSGKSTVVKALLLLEDNFKKKLGIDPVKKMPMFDLTSQYAHIGDFKSACRQTGENNDDDSFELAWTEKKGSYRITLCDSSMGSLYACYQSIEYYNEGKSLYVFVDFKNHKFSYSYKTNDESNEDFDYKTFNRLINEYKVVEHSYIEHRISYWNIQNSSQPIAELQKRIDNLKRKSPEFDALADKKKQEFSDFLRNSNVKKLPYLSREFTFSNDVEDMENGLYVFRITNNVFTEIYRALERDVELTRRICSGNIAIHCPSLSEYEQGGLGTPYSYTEFEYLYAHNIKQNAIYSILDKNDYTAFAIHEYYKYFLTHQKGVIDFMSCWLKVFEIGTAINIQPMPGGEMYAASIRTMSGVDIPLKNLGMGAIQIVVMLLRLAVIADNFNDIVMIEEPEQNLHPKLQSKLADLFLCVHIMHAATIIVETHSEYLIRRVQYLLAKGSFILGGYKFIVKDKGVNPFQIYYFPSDGQQPYPMEFQESGLFANQFGEGFFDESSNLLLSVLSNARKEK